VSRCPQCQRGDLVERRNKKTGQPFYGCSRYPDCKFAVADLGKLRPSALTPAPADPLSNGQHPPDSELVSAVRALTEAITSLAKQLGARSESDFSSSISQVPAP
jgi:ssDNA-binding Zn-finger/Zn-ribbon topoisomerase 1